MNGAMWIGGRAIHSETKEEIRNPYNGDLVGSVSVGNTEHLNAAIQAADEGFSSARNAPVHHRVELLEAISKGILDHQEELAQLMVAESGKPIRLARGEVQRAALTFSLGIDAARGQCGTVEPMDIAPAGEGRVCMVRRVPRGPIAAIAPYNFPLNLVAHKLSPALAVGTTAVLKPAAQCPLTGLRLLELMHEKGVSPGWMNGLHMPPSVAQGMVEDPRLRVLSFTGSAPIGWKLKNLAGEKQVCLELGGNAPLIIDEGTSIEEIMDRILVGAWAHGGQVCIKTQRILVHESLFDEFLEAFKRATLGVACGDPLNEETLVGPLIDARTKDRVMRWIRDAEAQGAKVECGAEADGNVVQPTILTQVNHQMSVVCEEVFGPVTTVQSFRSFSEALEEANRGPYGLHAGVFTPRLDRAFEAFDALDYGGVLINDIPTFRVDNIPYGGTRSSGIGREGVRSAAQEYTEDKLMVFRAL